MAMPAQDYLTFVGGAVLLVLAACGPSLPEPPDELPDSVELYLSDIDYRRGILERDLLSTDNLYAQRRLQNYGLATGYWESLAERDRPSRPLLSEDVERLVAGLDLELRADEMTSLNPAQLPADEDQWRDLGRRVMEEYPLRADPTYETLVTLPGALAGVGFIERDGIWSGLRVFEDEAGNARIGPSCSQCHFSEAEGGEFSATLANKDMDIGSAFLLALGRDPEVPLPEDEDTPIGELHQLGPGRVDLLLDGVFNPYAIPDMGGIADQPYLQQNANWHHRGAVTLAIRCETLFITAGGEHFRIPRALSWAVSSYLRGLAPPTPLVEADEQSAAGALLFTELGCESCHTPPSYTSEVLVSLDTVGTDPAAGSSTVRATGYYRIPSLRGVARTAPYLHHGAVESLEELFDPDREEPGHPWGRDLDPDSREQLIAFLRSI